MEMSDLILVSIKDTASELTSRKNAVNFTVNRILMKIGIMDLKLYVILKNCDNFN